MKYTRVDEAIRHATAIIAEPKTRHAAIREAIRPLVALFLKLDFLLVKIICDYAQIY